MGTLSDLLAKFSPLDDEPTKPAEKVANTAPAVVRAPSAVVSDVPVAPLDVNSNIQAALAQQQTIPTYVAPQIDKIQENPEDMRVRQEREKETWGKLQGLQENYKQQMQDAEDRKFKSSIFAAIGNYLPQAIAGATAMNTHAAVKAPDLPKIVPTDDSALVHSKYQTDYDKLLDQYKVLKDGKLTPKDEFERQKVNAYLKAGEANTNARVSGQKASTILRGTGLGMRAEKDNELSDKQLESLSSYDDTLTSLKRIQTQKKKVDTGPLANIRNKAAATVGIDDPEVTSLRSEVIDTLAAKIKALSGTAANESEVKRLEITLPSINDSDAIFDRKLTDAETRINEARQIREDHFRNKQGKNVAGYSSNKSNKPISAPSPTVRIQGPSGQVANVTAEQAEKYLSKPGYKKVD